MSSATPSPLAGPGRRRGPSAWPPPVTLAMIGLLAWGSVAARGHVDTGVAIWPANGLLLALLLTSCEREGLLFLLWGMLADAVFTGLEGLPFVTCLRTGAVNGVELLIACVLLQRYNRHETELSQPADLFRFALFAGVIAPLAATGVAMLLRVLLHQPRPWPLLMSLFLAHGLGTVTVTPMALEARRSARRFIREVTSPATLAALAVLVLVTFGVFWQTRYPLLFLVLPPLVAVVVIRGLVGGAVGLFLITVIAFGLTMDGYGPGQLVRGATDLQKTILLQGFITVAAGLTLVLAGILAERDRAVAALQAIRRDLEHLATVDGLTGIANRRRLDEFLGHEFRRARRQGERLSILMVDIDHFKKYNDRYGHPMGDSCLRAVAAAMQELCRRPGDLAARYGGEEFAIVLASDETGAIFVAEALREAVRRLRIPHADNPEHGGLVTMSIGIATLTRDKFFDSPEEMLREADARLYEAKFAGRNRIAAAGRDARSGSPTESRSAAAPTLS